MDIHVCKALVSHFTSIPLPKLSYSRGENPVGTWTLKVKDQSRPNSNGTLLGWDMMLWGSSIDPANAKKFDVPVIDYILPPMAGTPLDPVISPSPTSSTKKHPKPTDHLPDDHGHASGENTKPAFASATASPPAVSGTPDVGWFSDLGKLVSNQKWFFGAIGAVSIFGISTAVFFWRRRSRRLANYTSLSNDDNDLGMAALGSSTSGPRTTRDLYDAFGEVSDDDFDETTALRQPIGRSVEFHPGFLEDDEPTAMSPKYHDEPEADPTPEHVMDRAQNASPVDSGDGSWVHASRE